MVKYKIKIVHVCTSVKGGAGIAAYRIHVALLKNNIDSHILSLDKNLGIEYLACTEFVNKVPLKKISLLGKIKFKISWRLKHHFNIYLDKKEKYIDELNKLQPQLQCEIATLPFSEYDILKNTLVQDADIIHLHWVTGILDYPSFFKHNVKPVVWTMHDMNPFQGIFHYKEDEFRNEIISGNLNKAIFNLKQAAFINRKSKAALVFPSNWLLSGATLTKAFEPVQSTCIRYPLDVEIFKPLPSDTVLNDLKIPEGNTVFLFIAESIKNKRKGFDILISALAKFQHYPITLLVIGNSQHFKIDNIDCRLLGTINDPVILSKYYAASDAFILSSREDNLPNVMLESITCGTPVLAFNVGGMSEIIQNDFNGIKGDEISVDALVKIINNFIQHKKTFSTDAIRNFGVDNFSNKLIADKYEMVYESMR